MRGFRLVLGSEAETVQRRGRSSRRATVGEVEAGLGRRRVARVRSTGAVIAAYRRRDVEAVPGARTVEPGVKARDVGFAFFDVINAESQVVSCDIETVIEVLIPT